MECFTVYADEIEGRIDPLYYRSEFVELNKKLENSRYRLIELREYIKSFDTGKNLKQISKSKDAVQFIRTQNVRPIYLETEGISYTKDRSSLKKTNLNDVLFVRVGVGVGDCCAISKEQVGFTFSDNIIKISLEEGINPFYLTFYLDSTIGKTIFGREQKGSGKPVISQENISNISVPLPPLQTQTRIAQLMDNAYEIKKQKETEAQRLIGTIGDYALAELSIKLPELKDELCYVVTADEVKNNRCDAYYYQPKFTLAESKLEAVDYPVFSIGELITDLSGGATPKVEGDFYTDIDGVFFLRVQNISMEGIILEDVKFIKREVHEGMLKRSQLNKNDLVYTITGRIGSVAVVPEGFEGNINQHSIRFHLKEKINNIDINPYYVAIFLNTELGNFLAIRKATGGTRPALDYHALKSLIIPLPSEEIQDKITKEVKARMQKAEQLRKEAKEVLEKAKERVERIILGEEEI